MALEGIIGKANRALALLNNRMRVAGGFQFRTTKHLGSLALYKCHEHLTQGFKILLRVGKVCPVANLIGESGWIPLIALIRFNNVQSKELQIWRSSVEYSNSETGGFLFYRQLKSEQVPVSGSWHPSTPMPDSLGYLASPK